ncbi:MAG: hypothetical protein JWM27_2702 [Gemmatimonadetes bacterium]|nr:hypothetical protein [Gemmatimonadota bacterium]
MVTREDVESFFLRMGLDTEEVGEGMWVVRSVPGGAGLVVHHSPPVLVFRLKVLEVPKDESRCAGLYRRLLEYNATDLLHAAYGLEQGDVILTESLELENLDFNEFQATVDSFQLAVAAHMESLAEYENC